MAECANTGVALTALNVRSKKTELLFSMPDLQEFAESVWIVGGPPVRAVGVTFTTRMIIVKLTNGSLWVNSPVPIPHDLLDRITARGG
ncbi:MAG: hypothetical protein WB586_29485 [Chthoniobacterales bacterium]